MKKILFTVAMGFISFHSFSQSIPNYIPTNGLISFWGLDGNVSDYSDNNNDGTIIGNSTFADDRFGSSNNAFQISNSSDIICTSNSFNNIQIFSISLWFKSTNNGFLFGQNNGQCVHGLNWDRNISIRQNGNLEFYVFNGIQQYAIASGNYKDNLWHNVVVTLSASGMKIYVDGNFIVQNANATSAQNYQGYWRVGGLQSGGNNSIIASLDEIGIWDRELTLVEINIIYQQGLLSNKDSEQDNYTFYPNPVNDNLIIESYSALEDLNYNVFDQHGRLVLKGVLNSITNIINVSKLLNGVYFVQIENKKKSIFKFIKI